MNEKVADQLRHGFKYLNLFMVLMYRLGFAPLMSALPPITGRFMVIVSTGRKTGLRRQTPVNFAIVDGELYCTAGFGAVSHWYKNVMANPDVEVWLPTQRYAARAYDISESPDRLTLLREVLKGSGFASFAAGINPYTITDPELSKTAADYRLLHIKRLEARRGPGDLAWIWPLALLGLAGLQYLRAGKRT